MLRAGQAERNSCKRYNNRNWKKPLSSRPRRQSSLTHFFSQLFRISVSFVLGVLVAIFSASSWQRNLRCIAARSLRFFHRAAGQGERTLDCISKALRLWLLGLLFETLIVGVLAGFAVWRIGLPSPLALGVISGAAEFVPYVGPF